MINPALYSRWTTERNGIVYNITIDGIWATGCREGFTIVSYDLKYDHLEQIQNIPAEKLMKLIEDKKLVHLAVS